MNKKGFMFVETIVMCSILMVGLLLIYNSYRSSIAQQKEKLNYNTTAGELKLYHLKEYIVEKEGWKCDSNYNCKGSTGAELLTTPKEITGLNGIYDIQSVIFGGCEKEKSEFSSIAAGIDFQNYISSLKDCKSNDAYRFVAEFKDPVTSQYSYAWLEFPIIES